jgi:ribosome biogenesis GTPase
MHFSAIHPALVALGFTPYFHQQFLSLLAETPAFDGWLPERVTAERRGEYQLLGPSGTRRAMLSGRLQHELGDEERPCVGDFVLAKPSEVSSELTRIEHRFSRASAFMRKSAGGTARAQSIAANIDVAFVVNAFSEPDADPMAVRHGINPRRIERYLRAVAEAPAEAIVLLSKADLPADAEAQAHELRALLGSIEVLLVSSVDGRGFERLSARLGPGVTAVLVGPSGVGKSSVTNRLLGGEVQRVDAVRELDARGKHTTTHREIFVLPSGGLLIDTPGMRELGLHAESAASDYTGFDEISALACECRYRDCRHQDEPGCAVLAAVEAGQIARVRLEHAKKLQREIAWQASRSDARKRSADKRQYRVHGMAVRAGQKLKGRSE